MNSFSSAAKFADGADIEQQRLLVQRVLASEALARSERLCDLLLFVCDLTLAGRAAEINEQRVGEAVFGRRKDYDSSADGIVRTQASRLRQRLRTYFEGEGSAEPMVITIPRGSYVPVFELRSTLPEEPLASTSAGIPLDAPADTSRRSRISFAWGLVVVLSAACALFALRVHQVSVSSASVTNPLWKQLFAPGKPTLLVPGDSSLVNYQSVTHRNIDLDEYVAGDYRAYHASDPDSIQKTASSLAVRRYTSVVDLEIAQALSLVASGRHSILELRYPREVRPNDLKQSSLILVGSHEANPWVALLEPAMNFVFEYDRTPDRTMISIVNRAPRGSEPKRWEFGSNGTRSNVYAVVAYRPNLEASGDVLILEGITMAGTESAWDFVSDERKLTPFLRGIRQPDGKIPYFEVVLSTQNLSGSAAETMVLATRVSER